MRMMLAVVIVVLVLIALYRMLNSGDKAPASPKLPELGPGEYQEVAAIADGPDRGFGTLRITPSQLIFAGNSGRVTSIERLDITGVTTTTELPDHSTAKPVLAVSTSSGVAYFSVDDPEAWAQRLL